MSSSRSTRPDSIFWIPRSSAERRQLTVMFCDLVGSTALSAQLDPGGDLLLIRWLSAHAAAFRCLTTEGLILARPGMALSIALFRLT